MPAQSKTTLKGYFAKAHPTTEAEYGDLIDSMALDPAGSGQSALSAAMSAFMAMPGLAGFWPGNIGQNNSGTPQLWDHGPNAKHMSFASVASTQGGGELVPFLNLNGSNYALTGDSSPFDINGNESYLASQLRGLTVGAWIRPRLINQFQVYMAKAISTNSNLNNYRIQGGVANLFTFTLGDGSNTYVIQNPGAYSIDTWYFVVGRFRPSVSLDIIVNGVETRLQSGIPATAYANPYSLVLGGQQASGTYNDITSHATCYQAFAFVSQAKLPDTYVDYLYDSSRGLFLW